MLLEASTLQEVQRPEGFLRAAGVGVQAAVVGGSEPFSSSPVSFRSGKVSEAWRSKYRYGGEDTTPHIWRGEGLKKRQTEDMC